MKLFKYLVLWEIIFYVLNFLGVLLLIISIFASNFSFGIGDLLILYSALQTGMTLQYRSLNRQIAREKNPAVKKQTIALEGWKKLYAGFNIKISFFLWGIAILYNFFLGPLILQELIK